jgi:myosin heavy subunit
MEHDILGKVYRVAILYKSSRGAQGMETSKRLRANMKNAAKQIADEPAVIGGASSSTVVPAIEPKPAEVPTPCDNNGDASSKQGSNKSKSSSNSSSKSSSSSASSSSSSKKTKKKKKKKTGKKEVKKTLKTHGKAKKKDDARKKELAKKAQKKSEAARKQAKITADEEKQVKKLADAEAKAHSAATKKAQADQKKSFTSASGNLDKINKALEVLNANLLSPHVVCMPPQVMTTIRSCLSKLNELATECRDVMIHGGLTGDANIVKDAVLAAKKADAVFAALAKRIGDMQITS